MAKRTITLIRHGKVNGPAALYGHTDIALSISGANDLTRNIKQIHQHTSITHILSSPLERCAKPAQQLSTELGLPLDIIEDLKEMHFGEWDGIPFDAFDEQQWQALDRFWEMPATIKAPEGESLQEFALRVIDVWEQTISKSASKHQLIICHGGVIRILIAHILDLDWRNAALFKQLHIDYASHTRIEIADHPAALPIIKYISSTTLT